MQKKTSSLKIYIYRYILPKNNCQFVKIYRKTVYFILFYVLAISKGDKGFDKNLVQQVLILTPSYNYSFHHFNWGEEQIHGENFKIIICVESHHKIKVLNTCEY